MFLRSNLRAAGIVYDGRTYSARYWAAIAAGDNDDGDDGDDGDDDDDGDDSGGGAVVGVMAHCWNGMVLVLAPRSADLAALSAAVRDAADADGRAISGLAGPWAQVQAARTHLGLADVDVAMDSRDVLFALDLDRLAVPEALTRGELVCRIPAADETALIDGLIAFRVAYCVETLGDEPGPALDAQARETIPRQIASGDAYALLRGDELVSCSMFNARLPDVVQVGGVYTPPALRGRGYGRAAVAGSLVDVRAQGARRSILFTAQDNASAQAAYRALGYQAIGDYGLVLLALRTS
jgi:GNAT superfamily N-acetyltransferase